MITRVVKHALLAAAVVLAGCDESPTSEDASPSLITVRAYIDVDGDGTLTEADSALSGREVTLTSASASLTETTNASGLANFEQVPPGSYTATLAGGVPAGTVLATASAPVVVAPFQGVELGTDFRFAYLAGALTGQLLRQSDALPAPGIPVALYRGTDTTVAPLATTTTDETGAFLFTSLRPGVYTLSFAPFPTMQLVGGNTHQVTVGPEQPTAAEVQFTGNLLMTIAEARQQPVGAAVAVEGVVIAGTGTFNARSMYLQDATGGLLSFGVDTATIRPQVGDSVRVIGTVGFFNDEFQVQNPIVTDLGTGTVPAPYPITGAELNAFEHQGELARATRLTVTSLGSGTTAYDVRVTDAAGTAFVVRIANSGIGIPRDFWVVGTQYDVTGVVNRFRTTAQLTPRSADDVQVAAVPGTVLYARQASVGDTVEVTAIVTAAQGTYRSDNAYVQDASGGMQIFNVPAGTNLVVGDSVHVRGVLGLFNDEKQIVRLPGGTLEVTRLGTGTVPAPQVMTAARANTLVDEGELVRIENAIVVSVPTTGTAYNIVLRDPAGTEFQLRVDGNVGPLVPRSFWTVGAAYDVTGPLGNFRGTAQVKPRGTNDIVAR